MQERIYQELRDTISNKSRIGREKVSNERRELRDLAVDKVRKELDNDFEVLAKKHKEINIGLKSFGCPSITILKGHSDYDKLLALSQKEDNIDKLAEEYKVELSLKYSAGNLKEVPDEFTKKLEELL